MNVHFIVSSSWWKSNRFELSRVKLVAWSLYFASKQPSISLSKARQTKVIGFQNGSSRTIDVQCLKLSIRSDLVRTSKGSQPCWCPHGSFKQQFLPWASHRIWSETTISPESARSPSMKQPALLTRHDQLLSSTATWTRHLRFPETSCETTATHPQLIVLLWCLETWLNHSNTSHDFKR